MRFMVAFTHFHTSIHFLSSVGLPLHGVPYVDWWQLNVKTGKQYKVLDYAGDFTHDSYQQKCELEGGKLPEPRDQTDNNFLDSLDTDAFVLGIKKQAEGQWVFFFVCFFFGTAKDHSPKVKDII